MQGRKERKSGGSSNGGSIGVTDHSQLVLSSVGIHKEIYLITVGLTEANVATVLAGWLSLMNWTTNSTG